MDAVNNLPKPVVIGVIVVILVIAGFIIFSTVNNIVTNNGYGTKEDIARRQGQGGNASGRMAPTAPQTQGGGGGASRGGYPAGYGSQGSSSSGR
jgi:uncharacterized membrane protein YgcG